MGIVGFDNDIGPDKKRAEWENDCLDNIMLNPDKAPVVLAFEDHAVHISIHERRMKEPSWMEAEQEVQQAYMAHVEEHRQFQDMIQQQADLQAMMTGQPPQDANATQPSSPSGKGAPTDVRETAAMADVPPGEEPV
jgi:hypothetical protein